MIIHGTSDNVVPTRNGRKLYSLLQKPHEPFWVEGAGHNDIVQKHGVEQTMKVAEFIKSTAQQSSEGEAIDPNNPTNPITKNPLVLVTKIL